MRLEPARLGAKEVVFALAACTQELTSWRIRQDLEWTYQTALRVTQVRITVAIQLEIGK